MFYKSVCVQLHLHHANHVATGMIFFSLWYVKLFEITKKLKEEVGLTSQVTFQR